MSACRHRGRPTLATPARPGSDDRERGHFRPHEPRHGRGLPTADRRGRRLARAPPRTERPAFPLQPARLIERAVRVKRPIERAIPVRSRPIERAVRVRPARPIERAVGVERAWPIGRAVATPERAAVGAIQVPAGTLRLQAPSFGAEPVPIRGRAPPVVYIGVRANVSAGPVRPESITLERRGWPVVPPWFKARPLGPQCVAHARHCSRICAVIAPSGRLARPVQSVVVCLLGATVQLTLSLMPPLRAGNEAGCAGPAAMIRPVIAGVTAPISDCALPCSII